MKVTEKKKGERKFELEFKLHQPKGNAYSDLAYQVIAQCFRDLESYYGIRCESLDIEIKSIERFANSKWFDFYCTLAGYENRIDYARQQLLNQVSECLNTPPVRKVNYRYLHYKLSPRDCVDHRPYKKGV